MTTQVDETVCPVIQAMATELNEPYPAGTRSTPEVERARGNMAADWLVRVYTPTWLRVAGLAAHADTFAGTAPIVDADSAMQAKDAARASAEDWLDEAADVDIENWPYAGGYMAAEWATEWADPAAQDAATFADQAPWLARSASEPELRATAAMLNASAGDLLERMLACR